MARRESTEMATWSAPATSPNAGLGEDDLKYLHEALYPVCKKYTLLGLQLGLPITEIRAIQQTDPGKCLLEMLSLRLYKKEPLTWNDIVTVLRSRSVDESMLANAIEKEYSHLFRPNTRVEFTSDHDQTQDEKEKENNRNWGRKEKSIRSDWSLKQGRKSDRQEIEADKEEDSDGKVRRGKMKKSKPEKHESDDESSSSSSEENEPILKVREKVEVSVPRESQWVASGIIPAKAKYLSSEDEYLTATSDDDAYSVCLQEALYPVREKYKLLGLQLGLLMKEIRAIQQTDPGECLLEMLSLRLNKTEPLTWNDVDTALRSECVGESRIANGIRKKYSHLFSPDSRVEHTSDYKQTNDEKQKEKRRRKHSLKQRRKSDRQEKKDPDRDASRQTGKMKKYTEEHDESSSLSCGQYEPIVKLKKVRARAIARVRVAKFFVPHTKIQQKTKKLLKLEKGIDRERKSKYRAAKGESKVHKEVLLESESFSEKKNESETAEEYSSEQEQDSDHEAVSEDPAEQAREGECGEGKLKWLESQRKCGQTEKQKTVQKMSRKANSSEEEVVSSLYDEGKAGKFITAKQVQGKEEKRRKAKRKAKQVTKEQYSDEEVTEKSALKPAESKIETEEKLSQVIQSNEQHTKEKVSPRDTRVKQKVRKKQRDLKADSRLELATKQKGKKCVSSDVTEEDSEGEEESEGSEDEEKDRDSEQEVSPPGVQSDQGSHEVGEDDLNVVFKALAPVAEKYEFFGLGIGVKINQIEKIQRQYTDPSQCLLQILHSRLAQLPALTWSDIDRALRSRTVGKIHLADSVKKEYGHFVCQDEHGRLVSSRNPLDQEPGKEASEKIKINQKYTQRENYGRDNRPQQMGKEQETDSDEEVTESEGFRESSETPRTDNKSTKTQRRVKKAKKHSEPEQGNAKRERKAQMKQQARHEAKIESKVRHKGSHTGTCKEQIAPKEVQSKSESESSVSSSKEEMVEEDESETAEEYFSEQEQYSDNEEVSEDPNTSESEVTKETKGFVCPATEKQKKVINQQYIQTTDRGDRRKSGAQKRKSRKKQRAESEIRCNVPDQIVTSSSHYGGKASQTVEKTNPSKQIQGKEDERRETITYKFKQRAFITEEFSDEEVREKPATKSAKRKEHKKLKTKEKSSVGTGRNEDERKLTRMKIIKTEYHLKTKENVSLSPDTQQKEKDKRTKVHKQANETNEGKDLKADSRQELATRRKAKNTLPSDVTEEDSEGEEEWYSAESSEEENRDTEHNVSVEEEEAEPSDDGITSSEEEVSEELKPYTKEKVKETKRKVTRKEMEKRSVPHLPGDNDPGERSEDQGEHSIRPKKRSRRRHRECSPIARGSSSPSTSQEEQQVQKRKSKRESDRERKKMVVKRKEKREKVSSSSATDDSSPTSEMLRNLTQSETKALVKVFKCLFGRLCCAIVNPVETAAQLQEKHLISHSLVKNLILSPESLQAKTISLVGALHTKIKAHPDRLFLFIELLMENESPELKKAGQEMLRLADTLPSKKRRDKRVKVSMQQLPEDTDPGSRDSTKEPKKQRRIRHKKSPVVRGSSSTSTSEKEQKKKEKSESYLKKAQNVSKSGEILPECDKQMNELSTLFNSYFGRLCCDITNPDEIAAQLQMKGLISKLMMYDILMSPASQQAKTISLIETLGENIKLRPDFLFVFIGVLLKNEPLRIVGSELLKEAGM